MLELDAAENLSIWSKILVVDKRFYTDTIFLTADIDWAPDFVIEEMLNLFVEYDACLTVFSTHQTCVYDKYDRNKFEIGIHPNFSPGVNIQDTLKELLNLHPQAIGVRSHSLIQSTPILDAFAEAGLKYDCNLYMPYHVNLRPFKIWNGLLRIPFFWEDDLVLAAGSPLDLSILPLQKEGLKIFNFHPIHVFLNTESMERYYKAKPFIKDRKSLLDFVNNSSKGVRTLLIKLLEYVKANKMETLPLTEICNSLVKNIR